MITKFKIFEQYEQQLINYKGKDILPFDMIGCRAILKDKKNVLRTINWMKGEVIIKDTEEDIGYNFIIKDVFLENDKIYITNNIVRPHKSTYSFWYNANNFNIENLPVRIFAKEDPYGRRRLGKMITKFKIFEQDYSDIDPYNEERWGGPKELEIDIITPKISDDKQGSFWYFGETIAILRKEDMEIEILAAGEIALNFEENGDTYYNDDAIKYANNNSLTDRDLEFIGSTTGFLNNNWFEFRINGNYADEFGGDVAYEYDEAIETAKNMIEDR